MRNELNIEQILKTNLKDYLSNEIDNEIEQKVKEFEFELKSNKDKYIEHLMKNIRILHEYNHVDNKINYQITFVNEYIIGDKENE